MTPDLYQKQGIINELSLNADIGKKINQSAHDGLRSDFALMVSMFSDDPEEFLPTEEVKQSHDVDKILRSQLGVPEPPPLQSAHDTYERGKKMAELFHGVEGGGLAGAKLNDALTPDALVYLPEKTNDLPEDVYHNLSPHQKRKLAPDKSPSRQPVDLYGDIVAARRMNEIRMQLQV